MVRGATRKKALQMTTQTMNCIVRYFDESKGRRKLRNESSIEDALAAHDHDAERDIYEYILEAQRNLLSGDWYSVPMLEVDVGLGAYVLIEVRVV